MNRTDRLTIDPGVLTGFKDALDAVNRAAAGQRVHTVGYCIGGTLLSMGCTETDHVAPWQSVYKVRGTYPICGLHLPLTSGGHNAGIVGSPAHPKRRFRQRTWSNTTETLSQQTGLRRLRCRPARGGPSGNVGLWPGRVLTCYPPERSVRSQAPRKMPFWRMLPVATFASREDAAARRSLSGGLLETTRRSCRPSEGCT
jgi:hypothetical protein